MACRRGEQPRRTRLERERILVSDLDFWILAWFIHALNRLTE